MQSTSEYSAPEQLNGENLDNKVDLWSIGIILYRLYFNEFPYSGETQVALNNDIKKKKKLKICEENFYFNDLIKQINLGILLIKMVNLKEVIWDLILVNILEKIL